MKLSIAIADANALPSAFVVFRGFEKNIPLAAQLGFDGVELALKRADEINMTRLSELLNEHGIVVSCISTGQVYADGALELTHDDETHRKEVNAVLKEFIDLAEDFGGIVNIGRVRGRVGNRPASRVQELFINSARELCDYALAKHVTLVLEPVNRYETDFINTIEEAHTLIKKVDRPNMMLMPDLFHMNIEDKDIGPSLAKHIKFIKYIHFADSNRRAPGQGHLNFDEVFQHLLHAGYNGWISAEILPIPNPHLAAKQTADFLIPYVTEFNQLWRKNKLERPK